MTTSRLLLLVVRGGGCASGERVDAGLFSARGCAAASAALLPANPLHRHRRDYRDACAVYRRDLCGCEDAETVFVYWGVRDRLRNWGKISIWRRDLGA
jgi:hypothetical protein